MIENRATNGYTVEQICEITQIAKQFIPRVTGTWNIVTTVVRFMSPFFKNTISNEIIATGERYMGTPYRFGSASGSTRTFDCSSFTQYAFGKNGVKLPRSSHAQSQVGKFVPRNQLKPGDLVFFYTPIHHVAIYIGNGKILHTYGAPGVTISDMTHGWWSQHYAEARRVL